MKKLAIIGCGAICRGIVEEYSRNTFKNLKIVALLDKDLTKCETIIREYGIKDVKICRDVDELLQQDPDIVLEVASPQAVYEYAIKVLSKGKILIILSSGALIDPEFREKIVQTCHEYGGRVYIPSGAIGGLDILKSLRIDKIEKIVVRTRKSPRSLSIHIEIEKPQVVYRGKASEAVKKFPLNVNILATIALATGIEPEVEIVVDPEVTHNIHEIEIYSSISNVKIEMRNVTTPWNPRTSKLAIYSTIQLLKELTEEQYVKIGT